MDEEAPSRKLPDGTLGGPVMGRGVRSIWPDWSVGPNRGRMHLTHADDEAALCGAKAPAKGWTALLTEGERSGNGDYCEKCVTAAAPKEEEAPLAAAPPVPEEDFKEVAPETYPVLAPGSGRVTLEDQEAPSLQD